MGPCLSSGKITLSAYGGRASGGARMRARKPNKWLIVASRWEIKAWNKAREGTIPSMGWPIGSGWGRTGGVNEDHPISGWALVGIVLLNTHREVGLKQGRGRRAKEVSCTWDARKISGWTSQEIVLLMGLEARSESSSKSS